MRKIVDKTFIFPKIIEFLMHNNKTSVFAINKTNQNDIVKYENKPA